MGIIRYLVIERIFSKPFFLHVFPGPPESMREHVVAASKEMRKGNWRECAAFILAVKVARNLC